MRVSGSWWPESLPELKRHSLFIDMRDPSLWKATVHGELLPQIVRYLEEWRGSAPEAQGRQEDAAEEVLECLVCMREQLPRTSRWQRAALEQQQVVRGAKERGSAERVGGLKIRVVLGWDARMWP